MRQFSVNDPCTSGILLSCSRELRQLTLELEITVIRYFKKCYSPFLCIHLRMTISLECLNKVFKCITQGCWSRKPRFFSDLESLWCLSWGILGEKASTGLLTWTFFNDHLLVMCQIMLFINLILVISMAKMNFFFKKRTVFRAKLERINSWNKFSSSCLYLVLQGFFKDLMTVNNPHVSPQRIEEFVNGAVNILLFCFILFISTSKMKKKWCNCNFVCV